jgi:oligopeptide/dipeptide ABC transporter ATP-binding protein
MYAGRKVEIGPTAAIITDPIHPYTHGLINCVPHISDHPDPERRPLPEIPGIVPAFTDLGLGCAFRPRCPLAQDRCAREVPPLQNKTPEHGAACWAAVGERRSQ